MYKYSKLIFAALILLSTNPAVADSDWTLRKDEAGISVYTREVQDSPINEVKAEADFSAAPDAIAQLLLKIENRPLWDSLCLEAKQVAGVPTDRDDDLFYLRYDMPWPVADRDMVMNTYVQTEGDVIRIVGQATTDEGTAAKIKGVVRVTHAHEEWTISPKADGTTHVTVRVLLDPAGPIPAWLINLLSVSQPYAIMKNLREMTSA